MDLDAEIRSVLAQYGHLTCDALTVEADADLYEANLTSQAAVDVMLALEETLGIEFPDHMLRRSTFASVSAIRGALQALGMGSNGGAQG